MLTKRQGLVVTAAALALVACADATTAPVATTRAVAQLEQLASRAVADGDVQGGQRFGQVADALRRGIRPSRYAAWTGDHMEEYLAMVVAEVHNGPAPATHLRYDHTLIMWHEAEVEAMHVLRLSTTGERGNMAPHATDPGKANYVEQAGDGSARWNAVRGVARIVQREQDPSCGSWIGDMHRVTCFPALYEVHFEVLLQPAGLDEESRGVLMWANPQRVRGLKYVLDELE